MSDDNMERVVVKASRIDPLWFYLTALAVAAAYAFQNPLYRWWAGGGGDDQERAADDTERAAQLAQARSAMQERHEEQLLKKNNNKKLTTEKRKKKDEHTPTLTPRIIDLGLRARRHAPRSAAPRESSSTTTAQQTQPRTNDVAASDDDDRASSSSIASKTQADRQTEHDALYAASLQALEEPGAFSSSSSSPSFSSSSSPSLPPTPAELRARQDVEYQAGLRQDNARRKKEEMKEKEEMQRAIQESILASQEQATAQQEQEVLEVLRQSIPEEPTTTNRCDVKTIQFRFSSGATLKRNFFGKTKLRFVRAFVQVEMYKQEGRLVRCAMSTSYPRKSYGEEEDDMILEDTDMFASGHSVSLMVQDLDA